jgi:hypothetical protein
MAITTVSELQTAVKRWLHRGDLDALIPDFITLGEARINRLLTLPEMQARATVVPSTVDRFAALPARFYSLVTFADDLGEELEPVTADDLEEIAAAATTPGRPAYYRLTSQIEFDRVADATYSFTLVYVKRLDLIADLTNSILTSYPDIYLYAALLSSAPYTKDDSRVPLWAEMFKSAVNEANAGVRRQPKLRTDLSAGPVYNIETG